MKNLLLACFMVFGFSAISFAQDSQATQEQPAEGAIMTFEKMVCDYGEIEQNSERDRYVKFTNTGTEPLIIKNARGSCGCTVPSWPKEPVMPGESGEIKISYATNRLGKINKTVTLTTNETGEQKHVIKVVGNVSKKEEAVPEAPKSILDGGK